MGLKYTQYMCCVSATLLLSTTNVESKLTISRKKAMFVAVMTGENKSLATTGAYPL